MSNTLTTGVTVDALTVTLRPWAEITAEGTCRGHFVWGEISLPLQVMLLLSPETPGARPLAALSKLEKTPLSLEYNSLFNENNVCK